MSVSVERERMNIFFILGKTNKQISKQTNKQNVSMMTREECEKTKLKESYCHEFFLVSLEFFQASNILGGD